MQIQIAQFVNMEANSPYLGYSGKKIIIFEEDRYGIEGMDKMLTSAELLQLANHNMVSFYDFIPELDVNQPSHGIMPFSVYIDQINMGFRRRNLQQQERDANQQPRAEIQKAKKILALSLKSFISNILLPSSGYLLLKKKVSFALYVLNTLILVYILLQITGSLTTTFSIAAMINILVSAGIYKAAIHAERFGTKKNHNASSNPLVLLFPTVFIILQIMNTLFFSGEMFVLVQSGYYRGLNYVWMLSFRREFSSHTAAITLKNLLLPPLTTAIMYFIIYCGAAMLTLLILTLFKKKMIRDMEEQNK